jgi:hypothetical protein
MRNPATRFQDGLLIRPDGFLVSKSGGWNRTSVGHVQSVVSRPTATAPEFGKEDSNLHDPASKTGGLPISRFPRVPCGSRTRLSSMGGWCLDRSAKGTSKNEAEGEGVEPSRHRCPAVFETAAVADRLALPERTEAGGRCRLPSGTVVAHRLVLPHRHQAPAGGLEPPIVALTGRRLTVRPHRSK